MRSILDNGPTRPVPARLNLARHVLAAATTQPKKTALAVLGKGPVDDWSYERLTRAIASRAAWIAASDVPPGGRILMRLSNSPDFPITFLAAIAAGRVPIPTPASLTAPEITRIAHLADPALVLADHATPLPEHPAPVVLVNSLNASDAQLAFADTGSNDPAYIVFTSGSSGRPRGVIHAHRAIWARHMMFDGWEGLTPNDRILHAGAFNWTYTLGTGLLDPWTLGATALVPAPDVGIDHLPDLIARHGGTIFAAVPGVFRRLLRAEDLPPMPRLRHSLSAGEKLPQSVRDGWQARTGTDIHEAYGQSECSTFLSGAPLRPAPPSTLGYAQPGRRVAILGSEGPVPLGEVGDLAISRDDPGLMLGYLDETAAFQPSDDWVRTGDLAAFNSDGSVVYHGRVDDVMTAGGFRVSPFELEAAALSFDGIEDAAAADRDLDPTTRIIALFYVAKTPLDEAKLARHLASRLAPFKRPRQYVRVVSLPRSTNGKLVRRQLPGLDQTPDPEPL